MSQLEVCFDIARRHFFLLFELCCIYELLRFFFLFLCMVFFVIIQLLLLLQKTNKIIHKCIVLCMNVLDTRKRVTLSIFHKRKIFRPKRISAPLEHIEMVARSSKSKKKRNKSRNRSKKNEYLWFVLILLPERRNSGKNTLFAF